MDNLDIRKEILLHLKDVKDIVNFLSLDKNQLCNMTDWKYIYNQHHYKQLIHHSNVKDWIIDYKFMQYFMALANYNIDQYNILLQFFKDYVPGHMERKVINFVFDTDDFDDFVFFLYEMTDQRIKNHLTHYISVYCKYAIVHRKNSVSDFWNSSKVIIKQLTGGDTTYTRYGEKLPDTNFIIITNQSHEHEPIMQHRITTIHLKHKPYTDFFTEEDIHILKHILS